MKRLYIILCALVLTLSFPMSVSATEGTQNEAGDTKETSYDTDGDGNSGQYADAKPDAVNEILESERFNGAVEQIQWLTNIFDNFSIQVVSVCAFLIIAAAMLKNVCAGTYCANTKFWDKVDDAHKKAEALNLSMIKGYFTGGQMMNTTVAGVKDGILALVPNIKAFTDFEEADIQPKQYFMKSIPQMCMCIIIGIFIYNGYYRDTAAVVGNFGSEAFTRVISAASPSELLDRVTQTTGMPAMLTDGRTDPQGKFLNKVANEGRKAIITEFKLTTNKQKIRVSQCVENWVLSDIQTWVRDYFKDEENNAWKVSAKTQLVPMGNANDAADMNVEGSDTSTIVHTFVTPYAVVNMKSDSGEDWVFDTSQQYKDELQDMYLRVIVTCKQTESSGGKNKGKDVEGSNKIDPSTGGKGDHVTLPSAWSVPIDNTTGSFSFVAPTSADGYTLVYKTNGKISSNVGNATITYDNSRGAYVIEGKMPVDNGQVATSMEVAFNTDLIYARDSNGTRHQFTFKIQPKTN